MDPLVQAVLALITNAPAAIKEITALYEAIQPAISASDQATINAALQAARDSDSIATAKAISALDAAST